MLRGLLSICRGNRFSIQIQIYSKNIQDLVTGLQGYYVTRSHTIIVFRKLFITHYSWTSSEYPEAYLEPSRTSEMELFAKIVKGFQPLTIFAKSFILDVGLGSVDSSGLPDCVLGIYQARRWWRCWCKFTGRNKVYGAFL